MSYNKSQRWDYTPLTTDKDTFPTHNNQAAIELLPAPGVGNCYHLTGISISNKESIHNLSITLRETNLSGSKRLFLRIPENGRLHIKFPHTLEFPENTAVISDADEPKVPFGDFKSYSIELFGWIGSPTS